MRRTGLFLICAGLAGCAASLALWHFAETRMGVMRDLYVRNVPLDTVLFHPVLRWCWRGVAVAFVVIVLRMRRSRPVHAGMLVAGGTVWLGLSLMPDVLGLATPWMLVSLAIAVLGGMLWPSFRKA